MLERDKLARAVEVVVQSTKEAVIPKLQPGDDLSTMLFLVDDDGLIFKIINLVTMGDIPPDVIEDAIKETIQEYNAAGYVVQGTMWFIAVKHGDPVPNIRPKDHPDRKECYVLTAGSASDAFIRSFSITRIDGKITNLEEQGLEGGATTGLFWDLLKSQKRTLH